MRTLILSTLSLAIAFACTASSNAQEAGAWNGFYAGVNAGYAWDSSPAALGFTTSDPGFALAVRDLNASETFPSSLTAMLPGTIGGIQAGFNWQLDEQRLVGLEADFQAAGLNGSIVEVRPEQNFFDSTSTEFSESLDWFATARARVGLLATPDLLAYATAGIAVGATAVETSNVNLTNGCQLNFLCADASSAGLNVGFAAGAGAEVVLAPNWRLKAEYLYVDLGERTASGSDNDLPFVGFAATSRFAAQTVRVGLNYHFD